jgi:hypothetical protein
MKTQPIFRNLISDLKCRHTIFSHFSPIKPLVFFNCVIVWVLLAIAVPQDIAAQSLSSIKSAEKAVEKAQEKVDNAREAVGKAQKAVDDEIAKMKKEAEKDPKGHGSNPELEKLRKERSEAQEKLDKAQEALDKAKERLAKAREKFEEKQRKGMEEALKKRPLPDDKKGLEKYKKDMDSWKNDIWGTDEGEDLKRRIREKIDEKLRRLENNEQSALPQNNNQRSVGYISIGGTYIFGHPESWFVPHQAFDGIMSSYETYSQLSEVVGGEFTPGDLSSQRFTGVEMSGRYHITPGIGAGIGIGRNLELGVQVSKFHAEWEGSMLYTVFPWGSNVPRTAISKVNTSATGMQSDLDVKYFLSGGKLRPYLHTGIRGQWLLKSSTHMDMAGMQISLDAPTVNMTTVSPYAGAGVRMVVGQNAFLQAGVSITNMPGDGYSPSASLSVGLNFGGNKDGTSPDDIQFGLIGWIKDILGPDYDDVEKRDDFDTTRRTKYDKYVVERKLNNKSHKEACEAVDIDGKFAEACKKVYDNETKGKK